MIPLAFHTVKPDVQAQIVPNQSVKASYATVGTLMVLYVSACEHILIFHAVDN